MTATRSALALIFTITLLLTAPGGLAADATSMDHARTAPPADSIRPDGGREKTMTRLHDPVQVSGSLLERLLGTPLSSLRLFALRGGALEQIPFQIDERLPDGTFCFALGREANAGQANNILDGRDFLLFRVGDSGSRLPRADWPSPLGVEIELGDPQDGGRSWVYLQSFPGGGPERLSAHTIELEHWDPWQSPELPFVVSGKTYRIEGMVNKIGGKHYKTAVNKSFQTPESAGGNNKNLLDGQRMRAWAEVFFGQFRIERNETNMIGGIDALHHGDIRGYGRQWMTIGLPLGMEGPRIYSDVFTYDRVIISPMSLTIPINPEALITRAGIEFGYDMNKNAMGMRFYSPNCMEGATIDGAMTEAERAMPDDWVSWYLIAGPQGSLLFRVDVDPELMKQTDSRLTYIDDLGKGFPPEDVPGSIGYARTTIEMESLKPRTYDFQIEWYFPPNIYREGGYDRETLRQFLNIKDNPIEVSTESGSETNSALSPPPLAPGKRGLAFIPGR